MIFCSQGEQAFDSWVYHPMDVSGRSDDGKQI